MSDQQSTAELRLEYETEGIDFATLHPDPVEQFREWFEAAVLAGVVQPNAMVLSTTDGAGSVSARAVLLKDFDHHGFVFFTNLQSDKGRQLVANPRAALTFVWLELHRQVRIEGPTSYVSTNDSDEYFASRPRGAQLAAAVSPQSTVVEDRQGLVEAMAELERRTGDGPVGRPPHWRGVRVRPEMVEFWQGRLHRLHDRARYRREGEAWRIDRLAP